MIVTLTTDFGTSDYYLGVLKGKLLSLESPPHIVDITHEIENHDITRAAIIVRNIWSHYPKGTVHIINVYSAAAEKGRTLLAYYKEHFFVLPDNGILSIIFTERVSEVYELPSAGEGMFSLNELFSRTVDGISRGLSPDKIGTPVTNWLEKILLHPVMTLGQLRGTVIYVDRYGNAMVNITRDTFDRAGRGKPFALFFRRFDPITTLSERFSDVPVGDTLCRFNSAGYLEIAIHMGNAATLLGLEIDDTVQIDFAIDE